MVQEMASHLEISIHALRKESDPPFAGDERARQHFNPRSP